MSETDMNVVRPIPQQSEKVRRMKKIYGPVLNLQKLVDDAGGFEQAGRLLKLSGSAIAGYLNDKKCPPVVEMAAEFLLSTKPIEPQKPMPIYLLRPTSEEERRKIETAMSLIGVEPFKIGEV